VILYELLTRELPFRGNTRTVLHQVLHDEPRSSRCLNDRIPRDLETICLKAMAKESARRYESATKFAADLGRCLAGEPIRVRPVGALERSWRWARRHPTAVGLACAIVVALLSLSAASASLMYGKRLAQERIKSANINKFLIEPMTMSDSFVLNPRGDWTTLDDKLDRA
jgi:eukaryotic-like serine/threonine-protein kinase